MRHGSWVETKSFLQMLPTYLSQRLPRRQRVRRGTAQEQEEEGFEILAGGPNAWRQTLELPHDWEEDPGFSKMCPFFAVWLYTVANPAWIPGVKPPFCLETITTVETRHVLLY